MQLFYMKIAFIKKNYALVLLTHNSKMFAWFRYFILFQKYLVSNLNVNTLRSWKCMRRWNNSDNNLINTSCSKFIKTMFIIWLLSLSNWFVNITNVANQYFTHVCWWIWQTERTMFALTFTGDTLNMDHAFIDILSYVFGEPSEPSELRWTFSSYGHTSEQR